MKQVKRKIPALIAMLFSLASWGFYLAAHLVSAYGTRTEDTEMLPFSLYLYSMIFSLIALIPYMAELVLCICWIKKAEKPLLQMGLSLLVAGLFPMQCFFNNSGDFPIWTTYLALVFVAEAVSVVFCLKKKPPETQN